MNPMSAYFYEFGWYHGIECPPLKKLRSGLIFLRFDMYAGADVKAQISAGVCTQQMQYHLILLKEEQL
jgi:hypothetical protein